LALYLEPRFSGQAGLLHELYQESLPKEPELTQKMPLDEGTGASDDDDEDDDDGGGGGEMIQVWKTKEYYVPNAQGGSMWVSTSQQLVFLLLCHESSHDTLEFPNARLKKVERETTIEATTGLQQHLQRLCQEFINDTPSGKAIHSGIACGSGVRFFKWKVSEPELLFCHVSWHIDLGSGNPAAAAKATESFLAGAKNLVKRTKF
jgi:hypothetical protein